jgi:type VI secretion system secreted protein Hcp
MSTNMFVKFSNIEGECEDQGHPKWCEIMSLEQDFSNPTIPLPPGKTEGPGAKPCEHSEIEIEKVIDKASAGLMKACWKGDTIHRVEIECFRAGIGQEENRPLKYFSIELESVIIKEFEYSVSEGQLVTETLNLVASKATYAYWQMDKKTGIGTLAGKETATVGKGND